MSGAEPEMDYDEALAALTASMHYEDLFPSDWTFSAPPMLHADPANPSQQVYAMTGNSGTVTVHRLPTPDLGPVDLRVFEGGEHIKTLALEDRKAPADVDTLRDEACPVCGEQEAYTGEECRVCQYRKVPDPYMDPDVTKAKEVDLRQDKEDDAAAGTAPGKDLECDNCGHTFPTGGGSPSTAPAAAGGGLERFRVTSSNDRRNGVVALAAVLAKAVQIGIPTSDALGHVATIVNRPMAETSALVSLGVDVWRQDPVEAREHLEANLDVLGFASIPPWLDGPYVMTCEWGGCGEAFGAREISEVERLLAEHLVLAHADHSAPAYDIGSWIDTSQP